MYKRQEQGKDIYRNPDIPVTPGDIDAVLLTHAHIDHSGRIPLLVKQGYSGPVYSTDATRDLCAIMLLDSAPVSYTHLDVYKRQVSGKRHRQPAFTTCKGERSYYAVLRCTARCGSLLREKRL